MNYRLLSSISLEAISIALFLILALGVIFFVCISRKSKAASYVPIDKQRAGRSKRVFALLFVALSLSAVFASGIIAPISCTPTTHSAYATTQNVNLATEGESAEKYSIVKRLVVGKIKNSEKKVFTTSDTNQLIKDAEFRYDESKRAQNDYYGEVYFYYNQKSTDKYGWTSSYAVFKHSYEESNKTIYYYITQSNANSNNEKDQYVIQDYDPSWLEPAWNYVFKNFLDNNLPAIMITLLIAAAFWAIILGINMAKAPDSATAGKFKTRLWQLFIGLFILIAAIFFLYWLLDNIGGIMNNGAIPDVRDGFASSSFRSFLDKLK